MNIHWLTKQQILTSFWCCDDDDCCCCCCCWFEWATTTLPTDELPVDDDDDDEFSADTIDCSIDGIWPEFKVDVDVVVCDSPTLLTAETLLLLLLVLVVEKFDSEIAVDVTGDESFIVDCVCCCCCWLVNVDACCCCCCCDWCWLINKSWWLTCILTTELAAELTADCWPETTVFSGDPSTKIWRWKNWRFFPWKMSIPNQKIKLTITGCKNSNRFFH